MFDYLVSYNTLYFEDTKTTKEQIFINVGYIICHNVSIIFIKNKN